MKGITKKLLTAAATAALFTPMAAMATNGYFGHGIGMKSMGMGGAGIAMAQDALASATNPAAAALTGNRIDFGLNIFNPERSMKISGSPAPGANGDYSGDQRPMFLIPEFGYNRDLGNDMAFGLTVVGRGGMNTSYNKVNPLFGSTKAGIDLAQLYISPTFAMKLNKDHSVGVTLNAIYQRFKAEGLENFAVAPPAGPSADPANVTGGDYSSSTGFSLGLGWSGKVSPTLTLGATYTTKADMSEFDDYAGLFAEQGNFDIPATAGVGIAFEATPTTTVALDVTKIYYSGVDSIANPLLPNLFTDGIGSDNGAGFGWEDMTVFKLGVSWQMDKDLVLRAGYNHGENPIPSSETFFNILAPGVVEDHITLGATKTLANGGELTFMFMHAYEKEVKGSGSIPAAFGGGEVDIKMSQNAVGIAYGWDM